MALGLIKDICKKKNALGCIIKILKTLGLIKTFAKMLSASKHR